MRYLLDTNTWIIYLKDPDSGVCKRLLTESPQDIVTELSKVHGLAVQDWS